MSASLVRKALDETSFATEEKLEQLSKSKKRFKPISKKKKLSSDKILKQNLKFLKALEYRKPSKKEEHHQNQVSQSSPSQSQATYTSSSSKSGGKTSRKKKKNQEVGESVFTDEDFEKFEREYFVS